MKLCIFEDEKVNNFLPLTWTRPVYFLFCGMTTLSKRISSVYPDLELVYHCRDFLVDTVAETTGAPVNVFDNDRYLFINGRAVFGKKIASKININEENKLYCADGVPIAVVISGKNIQTLNENSGKLWNFRQMFPELPVETIETESFEYPWEIINKNDELIVEDFNNQIFKQYY